MKVWQKGLAEFVGTGALLLVIVGSGIMGETLAQGNSAVALLANSLATGCGLYVLIQMFCGVSGAHFNPVVSFVEFARGGMKFQEAVIYVLSQVTGALLGVWLTHFIFGQSVLQFATHDRAELRFYVSEVVATAGLLATVILVGKRKTEAVGAAVAAYITAAYWCTSSTSFANPAVTIARSLTNTFSGIKANGVFGFILAQLLACCLIVFTSKLMKEDKESRS